MINLRYFYCQSVKIYNNLTSFGVIIDQSNQDLEANYGIHYFRDHSCFIAGLFDLRDVQSREILM